MLLKICSICILMLYFTAQSLAYFVTVDAHAEECFFDKVEEGTKMGKTMKINQFWNQKWKIDRTRYTEPTFIYSSSGFITGLTFEIAEGGFLDINVRILGPSGELIHEAVGETHGKYTFTANAQGIYTYCFSNKMSTLTPKVVMFNMAIGEARTQAKADGENTNKLEDMIRELSCKNWIRLQIRSNSINNIFSIINWR